MTLIHGLALRGFAIMDIESAGLLLRVLFVMGRHGWGAARMERE